MLPSFCSHGALKSAPSHHPPLAGWLVSGVHIGCRICSATVLGRKEALQMDVNKALVNSPSTAPTCHMICISLPPPPPSG